MATMCCSYTRVNKCASNSLFNCDESTANVFARHQRRSEAYALCILYCQARFEKYFVKCEWVEETDLYDIQI